MRAALTDLGEIPPLRWGVLGATSYVARRAVLPALRDSDTADLVCVASRDVAAAREVAAEFGARRAVAGYEAVFEDGDVEAVYVPLPNSLHREWTERAAAAGRHVLCEKPLAPSAEDAAAMAQACASAGVLLLEAYMTPFHPRHGAALDLARSGVLGDVHSAHAEFTFPLADPANHRWRPEMGGGALLDVGIYCLAPLLELAGRAPSRLLAHGRRGGGGVDADLEAMLVLGAMTATVRCSFDAPECQLLVLRGTEATLTVDRPFTAGPADTDLHLRRRDGTAEVLRSAAADPYRAMVEHFAAAVRGGSPLRRSAADSVALLELVDALRADAAV